MLFTASATSFHHPARRPQARRPHAQAGQTGSRHPRRRQWHGNAAGCRRSPHDIKRTKAYMSSLVALPKFSMRSRSTCIVSW